MVHITVDTIHEFKKIEWALFSMELDEMGPTKAEIDYNGNLYLYRAVNVGDVRGDGKDRIYFANYDVVAKDEEVAN